MHIEIIRLPPKEFSRKYGFYTAGTHDASDEGEQVIIPYGANTKTIMHEIAHIELGHTGSPETFNEHARRELAADDWVYKKLGRKPTLSEVAGDLTQAAGDLVRLGYRQNEVFNWLKERLEAAGYEVDDETRSALWWFVRDNYKRWKANRYE